MTAVKHPADKILGQYEFALVFKLSREKSRKTEAVFLVGSRGLRGGNRYPPRARFLFAAFSFGEAKEKVGRQPQISNMRFVLLYVWLVVCVKGMRNLLSSLYYRDSLFINYHSSLRLSSPLDRFGRM